MKTQIACPTLLCLSLLFFACSGSQDVSSEDPSPSPEKADLAGQDGKADSTAVARICKEMGAPPDCDICELKGWYGDGECDTFCSSPDPDCRLIQPQRPFDCQELDIEFEICLEQWGYVSKHCIEGFANDNLLVQAKACCPDPSLNMCEHLLGGGEECDPTLICGQAITCVDGKQYPTTCGPANCDQPIGDCPTEECDPTLVCGAAETCVDGKLYPTTCGPANCDEPIGDCSEECDPTLFCAAVMTCVDGKLYPSSCGPANCAQPVGDC